MENRYWSRDEYVSMLNYLIRNDYHFASFNNTKFAGIKQVFLRHDIDLCLSRAHDMAQIEKELGVHSTYYIMTRGAFYNIFSPASIELIEKIKNLGHDIGLHFDFSHVDHLTTENIE